MGSRRLFGKYGELLGKAIYLGWQRGRGCCSKEICTTRSFGLMENSPPGRVSTPAPLTGGTKSRRCSRCLPPQILGAGSAQAPSAASLLLVARRDVPMLSPPQSSSPGEGVRAARAKATESHRDPGWHRSGLAVPCQDPEPRTRLGLNTPEPLKTRSFPSSFTYVNDDPQEVIVGERRELASLDLLNHFITGTRSEWPLSAGSASPSPSAFI